MKRMSETILFADKEVPRLGLGTMPLAGTAYGPTPAGEAQATIEQALAAGLRLINTAAIYGNGQAETACGLALRATGLQDEVVLITKGGVARDPQGKPVHDARYLRRDVEASLKRLQLESVDLYQLHFLDPLVPLPELAESLAEVQQQGLARHIGVCNLAPGVLRELHALLPLHSHELTFSLFDPRLRTTAMATSRELGLPLLVWGVLAFGLLAKPDKVKPHTGGDLRQDQPWFSPEQLPAYREAGLAVGRWAAAKGKELSQVAARYALDEPGVAIVLWGIHRPAQLAALPGTLGWSLTAAERGELEQLVQQYIQLPQPDDQCEQSVGQAPWIVSR